jgi:hypothetical protein
VGCYEIEARASVASDSNHLPPSRKEEGCDAICDEPVDSGDPSGGRSPDNDEDVDGLDPSTSDVMATLRPAETSAESSIPAASIPQEPALD